MSRFERGRSGLSSADAWSVRAHGLAERATPTVALVLAVAALGASLVPAADLVGVFPIELPALTSPVIQLLVTPVLCAAAALMLAVRGVTGMTAPAALAALALWGLHSAAAATAAVSWSVRWREANDDMLPGATTSWLGDSTLLWLALAGVTGLTSLTIAIRGPARVRMTESTSWLVAGAIAVVVLFVLFVLLLQPTLWPLIAGGTVAWSLVARRAAGGSRRAGAAR